MGSIGDEGNSFFGSGCEEKHWARDEARAGEPLCALMGMPIALESQGILRMDAALSALRKSAVYRRSGTLA